MKEVNNIELLEKLRVEIERGWNACHDTEIVHRLAAKHPELSGELYEFFADVVRMALEPDEPRPELAAADDRMRDWLEREGYRKIAQTYQRIRQTATPLTSSTPAPAEPAKSFVALLKDRLKKRITELATGLEIEAGFLADVSDNPHVLPEGARLELARRAEKAWEVAATETLPTLRKPRLPMRRAASRVSEFEHLATNYEAIVRRSKLTAEQQRFWLSLS